MFLPFTYEYRLRFDASIYGGFLAWPFAEMLGGLAAAVMGIFCLWLAFGKKHHWFVRASPVIVVLGASALIPAYELGMVAITQYIVVLVVARLIRMPNSMQFSLSNLLLVILLFAVIIGFLVRVPLSIWYEWPSILWFGTGYGVLTLLAGLIASRKKKLGWRWLFVAFAPSLAAMVIWLRTTRVSSDERPRRSAVWLATLLIAGPVLVALVTLVFRAPIPFEPPPAQNGLPELLTAGRTLPPNLFQPFPKTPQALSAAVKQSEPALKVVRRTMEKSGWLGVNYEMEDFGDFSIRIPQRDPINQICRAFLAEAELAESEDRIDDALATYRDIIRLAYFSGRGGLPMDTQLAMTFEADALGRVFALRGSFSRAVCEEWIELLENVAPVFEPQDVLLARRRAWVDRVAVWQDRLVLHWLRFLSIASENRYASFYEQDRDLRFGLFKIELALRVYHFDHSQYPARLEELTPQYLVTVPEDPVNPNGFIYRCTDDGYLLYSIGPDGKDDGGQLTGRAYWRDPGDLPPDVLSTWCTLK